MPGKGGVSSSLSLDDDTMGDRDRIENSGNSELEFALDLLALADQFLVERLKQLCAKAVQKSIAVDNVAMLLKTADARDARGLRARCFHFALFHFGEVIATRDFS